MGYPKFLENLFSMPKTKIIKWQPSYLTFSSDFPFTFGIYNHAKNWDGILEYSIDKQNWIEYDGINFIESNENNKLYLRGSGNTFITGNNNEARFILDGENIFCDGDIETLLDYQTVENGQHPTMGKYCYYGMFMSCTSLITAPELPATTLTEYCYYGMFSGCNSLTIAPELPATKLANYCYFGMFSICNSLTIAPELPAIELAKCCYYGMFNFCISLTTAPKLPATTLAEGCYCRMFYYCRTLNSIKLDYTGNFSSTYFVNWVTSVASTGTFYYNGNDSSRGTDAIPQHWTVVPFEN